MDGKSKDIKKEQIEKIKQLFPEAVPEGKNGENHYLCEGDVFL